MDFEKFLGILMPRLAIKGMRTMVVSLPGTPQIQCLSAIISPSGYLNMTPHSAMALAV